MPLFVCPSQVCVNSGRPGKLVPQTRGGKFVKCQEIKLQEMVPIICYFNIFLLILFFKIKAEEVPVGHIPRSLKVLAHGELTRQCSPGDIVTVSGVFMPTNFEGFAGVRAGLITDTYIEAMGIEQHKKSYTDYAPTPDLMAKIEELSKGNAVTDKVFLVAKQFTLQSLVQMCIPDSPNRLHQKFMEWRMSRKLCFC